MTAPKFLAPLVAVSFLLAGCQNDGSTGNTLGTGMGTDQLLGTVVGAGAGGLAGSQFGGGSGKLAMTGVGVVLGGLLGSAVGKTMDKADIAYANQTTNKALETAPTNQPEQWKNPNNGHYGTITPTSTYQNPQGQYCREYTQTVFIGGQQQTAVGTACRQPEGSWQAIS